MNKKERDSIAVLNTHIEYIRNSIDEIKIHIRDIQKTLRKQDEEIVSVKTSLDNHLQTHKRDVTLLGIIVSIIAFIISTLTRFIV